MRLTLRVRGLPRGIHLAGRGLVEGRISGVQSAASLTTGNPQPARDFVERWPKCRTPQPG